MIIIFNIQMNIFSKKKPPQCDGSTDALPYIFTNFLTTTPCELRKLTT